MYIDVCCAELIFRDKLSSVVKIIVQIYIYMSVDHRNICLRYWLHNCLRFIFSTIFDDQQLTACDHEEHIGIEITSYIIDFSCAKTCAKGPVTLQ